LASRREFEEASISEFDVATPSCNNQASPTIDDIDFVNSDFNQEKEQANFNEFQKVLQDLVGTGDPTGNNYSSQALSTEIQFYPENSSPATVPELDFSHVAEMSLSSSVTQAGTIDNGNELAQLVAALDPSEALVSCNGWPADPREAAAQPQSASCEIPALALTPLHGSPDTIKTATIYPGETSSNNNEDHSSVTLTLPVVTAASFGQLSGINWPEEVASCSVPQESSYINSNACNEVHEDTALTNRPIIEDAQQNRPSVIVAARSRKRAIEEETSNKDAVMKLSDDDVPPAVLEKRRKGNERCKRYRMNKKQREAEGDAELQDLETRNSFLREEEQRLTARKRKLQNAYLDLIRQRKIRFF